MKKVYLQISKLLIFVAISFLFIACTDPQSKSVRVMTWNIWHGGLHGTKVDNFKKDTVNTVNILKVIQQEHPDILFMQETYCCGMDIAKLAGYTYSWRGSSNLSIHSKYPIIDTIQIYQPFNSHGVIIDIKGEKLICINVWLHYLPNFFEDIKTLSPDSLIIGEGTTRLKEITAILKNVDSLKQHMNLPVILGGDFNSGSHLDWVESTAESHYGKIVQWPVSKLMLESGYTDTFREVNPDPAKTLDGTWGFLSDAIISDRIDYIYYKGDHLKTNFSKIVKDDPAGGFFNSDHRAILSIINFEN